MKRFVILLALLVLPISTASADKWSIVQDDNVRVYMDDNGEWKGVRNDIEVATTTDTITAAESGKTFFVDIADGYEFATFTLPSASDGLFYTFIDASSGNGSVFNIDISGSDTFQYASMSAGDKLRSVGSTLDSVEVFSTGSNKWYVNVLGGAFGDGN